MSTNGNVHHADAEHYKSLINNNRGTDTEHRDLQTPRYSEQEGAEKSSRLLIHITSTLFTKTNQEKVGSTAKVESSFYLQKAAPNGKMNLGNVWWLYWIVPTSHAGSNVDVSILNRT